MYKPSITAEAARDIAVYMLGNPEYTYHNVILVDGIKGPALHFYFNKVGYPQGTFGELELPVSNLLQLLKFSLSTINSAQELVCV